MAISPSISANQFSATHIKKKSVTGALSYFIRTALIQGLGLVSFLILSAVFGPEEFGIYGIVIQVIGLLVFFSDVGLAAALVQKKESPTRSDYVTAFTVQQSLAWLIVIVCIVLAFLGTISDRTGAVGNWILLSLAVSFPMAALKTIPSIQLERKLEFNTLVKPQLIEQVVFQFVLIACALAGWGAMSYIPAILLRSISGVVSMYMLQPWRPAIGISKTALKALIGFGVQFQLNDFLARIKDQLLFIVLGLYFLPLKEFGLVQWAKNLSVYPYNLTAQNILAITFPTFSRLQHDPQLLKRALEKSLFFISLVIVPLLIGLGIFAYPLTVLVPKYAQWQPVLFTLFLFNVSVIGSAITTPLTNALNAIGKIRTTLNLMIFWTILTWIATPLAIWQFGYDGVAVAAVIVALTSFLPYIFIKRIVAFSALDQLWRQALAGTVMAVVGISTISVWSLSWGHFALGIIACGSIYVAVMLVLGYEKCMTEGKSLLGAFSKNN